MALKWLYGRISLIYQDIAYNGPADKALRDMQ